MMLRYIYFVSLLLCISLSEEEFVRKGNRHFRSANKHGKGKVNRKREDYETYDDKDTVAHIDVAGFIQNPDDTSVNRGHEQRRLALVDYADDRPILNVEIEKDRSQDYQSLGSDNIPEVNIYSGKRVPQYVNINARPTEQIIDHLYKTNGIKNVRDDIPYANNLRHNTHAEKKCALRNMKIPFFSRNKVSTTKTKKNKKRKLFAFRNSKKNTNMTKFTESNYNTNNMKSITKEPHNFKVNKRSYFERLCPVCKQKFISKSNIDFLDKFRRTANNVIHNSRQYYQNKKYGEAESESDEQPNNSPVKHQNQKSDNDNFNDYIRDRRWKRNDEIEKTGKSNFNENN